MPSRALLPRSRRSVSPTPQRRPVERAGALRLGDVGTPDLGAQDVIELQHAVGNAAVQRLFGRKKKVVTPTAPDTRSDERKAFDAKTFEKRDWVPSTGTGKFDAIYKPQDVSSAS